MAESNSLSSQLHPQERLKQLIEYSNQVDVDIHLSPLKYYRSGIEMVRQAKVYQAEGNLEFAYVLYVKFMTLFLEKIRKHPEFNTVPIEVKTKNQAELRKVLPIAEQLKQQLLDQYAQDYNKYMNEIKQQQQKQIETKKTLKDKQKETKKTLKEKEPQKEVPYQSTILAKIPENLDKVTYPCPDPVSVIIPKPSIPAPSAPVEDSCVQVHKPPIVPTFDRTQKPSDNDISYDSNVLRTVVVPVKVMTLFQAMAHGNTFKNIETCGILTGILEKNELRITHLILPKQKGTSDSCITMNEEEVFEYQDQHNLLTLGWIHTHPTQTAFLSSVDLHTQCPYQLMMPEAVAIVSAPKYNDTGFFNLTKDYGLHFIAKCGKTGFHPHPTDPPLFTVADHVRIENNAPLEVLDLR